MLRVALVGAGVMGRAWIDAITSAEDVELAAVVDLDLTLAEQAAAASGRPGVTVARDLAAASSAGLDAVINVTVPGAHHAVNSQALSLGLPVLCEKPITPTVAEALSVAAAAESTGLLVMASQSRRYGPEIAGFRERLIGLGGVGTLTTEFFLGPHFGGFREEMPHVLLVDMAIHAFDAARYLLDDDPVAVYCHESNPPWSWYRGAASATAVFEMRSGAAYTYTGSWVSVGFRTSWNGRWRASGRLGTAIWDGDSAAVVEGDDELGALPEASEAAIPPGITGALAEFHRALRTGETPSGEIHSNILSLAMVEAAVRSSTTGSRVTIDEVVADARRDALERETRTELRPLIAALELGRH
jgi:predicted dehydrogenase